MIMLKREKDGVIYGANEGSIIYAALIADGFEPIKEEKNDNQGEKSLEEMKVDELKQLAKDLGLTGASNFKRDELIEVIQSMRQIG